MEQFFEDYLGRLRDLHDELEAVFTGLPQEALDWVPGEDMNSLVVLVCHAAGVERFWIGLMALNDGPSERSRDLEFQMKGLNEAELKARLAASEAYAREGLERLTLADLATMRLTPRQMAFSVGWSLLQALDHTAMHVGHAQINRQLWEQRQK
ncbi:MAG: DinB family protein [Anaerolineae bacterium]|nr:DinB family protein [Anaerolineae bacterium]